LYGGLYEEANVEVPDSARTRQVCRVVAAGVPGCDSGAGGRLAFVIREFAAAIRRRRTYRSRRTR